MMAAGDAFETGDYVVYLRTIVAQIAEHGVMDVGPERCDCFVLKLPAGGRVVVPFRNAPAAIRPLATEDEARRDLEILRQPEIDPYVGDHRQQKAEQERVLKTGTRVEIASLLRRLYQKKAPATETQSRSVRVLEDLVLEEIAVVLGLSRAELEKEMRGRHPLFKKGGRPD